MTNCCLDLLVPSSSSSEKKHYRHSMVADESSSNEDRARIFRERMLEFDLGTVKIRVLPPSCITFPNWLAMSFR